MDPSTAQLKCVPIESRDFAARMITGRGSRGRKVGGFAKTRATEWRRVGADALQNVAPAGLGFPARQKLHRTTARVRCPPPAPARRWITWTLFGARHARAKTFVYSNPRPVGKLRLGLIAAIPDLVKSRLTDTRCCVVCRASRVWADSG